MFPCTMKFFILLSTECQHCKRNANTNVQNKAILKAACEKIKRNKTAIMHVQF